MMRFDVMTIFPKMFESPFKEGIVGQAITSNKIELKFWNLRDHATDAHKTIDDRPFGGGDGMVMLPEMLKLTLDKIQSDKRRRVIYLSPQGPVLTQEKAKRLAIDYDQVVLICGRYGGIDERFIENYVDEELSIGDYVISGGELAAMVVIDAVARFMPGVLGNDLSPVEETFKENLLEQPLYTRPREFEGKQVPEVLLSGHHQKIKEWQRSQRILRTLNKRPDLLTKAEVTKDEILKASEVLPLRKNIAVGLIHYPVYNKTGEVVATNVTNLDIHDIARACRTYGIDQFYIITPAEEQLAFVGRVLAHWQSGRGTQYNPVRKDSLINTKTAPSIEAALEDWGVKGTKLVATSAREVMGPQNIGYPEIREKALKEPIFLVFGTGWGLENTLVRRMDYILDPIRGRAGDGFRHLSVRSAVSITLDRVLGPCY
ncbi:MAG: tRNA (guanosine(37)-N1)-methyltransferase TrmD [Oligoflexia bacterium]|nr:tRNA (guanosine(37)-N1)-methyltransferase TrmD [Oligoflexia bacterium]